LLEVRLAEEREQAARVVTASVTADAALARLRENQARQTAAEEHVAKHRKSTACAGTLAMLGHALHAARQRTSASAAALDEALAAVEEERNKLAESMKVRRSLERLRDYQRDEWEVDVGRRERREMDEIAARVEQRRTGQSL
jgi:flagellar export protein FliJ